MPKTTEGLVQQGFCESGGLVLRRTVLWLYKH